MKPSRIVLLLVALLAGGLAAFLATRGGDAPQVVEGPTQVVQEAKTQVLVAIAPIGLGQRLSTENVQWQDWPEGAVRPDYITVAAVPDALAHLTGAVARFEIFPGDPVTEAKLVRTEQGYLSAILEKGKRAVSIPVSAESASGGFIVPNDHVDVILTHAGAAGQVSETILYNAKVLAIGTRLGETGTTGAPADPENPRAEIFPGQTIATLELDPAQGESLIDASKAGQLSLALRSISDFAGDAGPAPRGSGSSVRMIRFGQESSVTAGQASSPPVLPSVDPAAYSPPAAPAAPDAAADPDVPAAAAPEPQPVAPEKY